MYECISMNINVCMYVCDLHIDRYDIPKDCNEIFFRNIKFWVNGDDAPPVFVRYRYRYVDVDIDM